MEKKWVRYNRRDKVIFLSCLFRKSDSIKNSISLKVKFSYSKYFELYVIKNIDLQNMCYFESKLFELYLLKEDFLYNTKESFILESIQIW